MKGKIVLTVPLPSGMMRKLNKAAKERMTSKAAIAREALAKLLTGRDS